MINKKMIKKNKLNNLQMIKKMNYIKVYLINFKNLQEILFLKLYVKNMQ